MTCWHTPPREFSHRLPISNIGDMVDTILTCGFPNSIFAALLGRQTARDRRSNASA
jgi:hypothetical protein